ncbi:substrate-binding domain-containing protein [Oscillibacter sp.]|uniref:PstS family phosphate ABC transporter substrate-binding protein n=1 Tax=Oscillibacter sp. TaxID=1945593 RepID=UPI0028A6707C|nr:substrate-binding domain-containing protein [Oscillibacter sp.]
MKNRLVSLFLLAAVLALSACGAPGAFSDPSASTPSSSAAAQVNPFVFTRENFPNLDGSTSTVPLAQAIASVLLGETREETSDLFHFSKTTQSYRTLMWGDEDGVDLLIAAEPPEVIWQEKEAQSFQWQMEPFAIDALVFVVNADNPVDSLTTEQIQQIYTGKITNWSQVGGDDLPIIPFQRNEEAGSQTAMNKLVMKGLPMMEAPANYVRGEMGDLIEAVAAYDDSPSAIGYTMYYYANDMNMADGLKILAVDGVVPSGDTIRNGDYPFLNNYYVVCGEQPSEATQVLYDWILSDEGQKLVAHEGYVPVTATEAAK